MNDYETLYAVLGPDVWVTALVLGVLWFKVVLPTIERVLPR